VFPEPTTRKKGLVTRTELSETDSKLYQGSWPAGRKRQNGRKVEVPGKMQLDREVQMLRGEKKGGRGESCGVLNMISGSGAVYTMGG